MAKGYDWATIKAEYETGQYSMRELSEKHGFSENYGARKALKENWEKGKSKEKVKKMAADKVLDYMSTTEAELRNEFAGIFKLLRNKTVEEVLAMYKKTFEVGGEKIKSHKIAAAAEERLKAMRAATHVINNCRKNEWEIYEIQEVAKKIEQDIKADVSKIDFSDVDSDDLKELINNEKEG